MSNEIVLWGQESDDYLNYDNMNDAIESALDEIGDLNSLPETIEICGFVHIELPRKERIATDALFYILENFDGEYANPDGDGTEPTDKMKIAAEEFAAVILDEYKVWACEVSVREQINVMEWVKENRPDWLKEN